jgi:periplasmic protein TonB
MSSSPNRSSASARRADERSVGYSRRIMISLAITLGMLIGLANIPATIEFGRIGWTARPHVMAPHLEIMQPVNVESEAPISQAPIADTGLMEDVVSDWDRKRAAADEAEPAKRILTSEARRIDLHRVLNFAEEQPQLIGGLAGYYLNIEYPEEAREAGIQGRLLLSFVVERDGRTTDIRVEQSLHPLCDSAAVVALRRSRFVAGRQNGESVRVRMRLPVRFMLLDEPAPSPALSQASDQSGS